MEIFSRQPSRSETPATTTTESRHPCCRRWTAPRANAVRHADRLGRINPQIVEAFLARAEEAELLDYRPTYDKGYFYLTASDGWELPDSLLVDSRRAAFVVTRADTRYRQAIKRGEDRAAEAVMLAPSTRPFADVVAALRRVTVSDMLRGAVLYDETDHDDYTLFVYECAFDEGVDGTGRGRQVGRRLRSWLVRVDTQGRCEPVAWEMLANLTAADGSGSFTLPDDTREAAWKWAEKAAEDEKTRRERQLGEWADRMIRHLQRLPRAAAHSRDRTVRRMERKRVKQVVQTRIGDVKAATRVSQGKLRLVGWTHVVATGDQSSHERRTSEPIAMGFVNRSLTRRGWQVTDVAREKRGYDLYAVRGPELRCVEVKGCDGAATSSGVDLTPQELIQAELLGDKYWLYIVDRCADGKGTYFGEFQNPAESFETEFEERRVHHLKGSALKGVLSKQGARP